MKGDHQHDKGQEIDQYRKTAKKPAGYLCNNQDTRSLTGVALKTIGLRAAENKCGYQEKWRDRNAIDQDKQNQAYNCEYQTEKAYWYRMFLKSGFFQLWFQEYGSHPWTLAQSTCRTDYGVYKSSRSTSRWLYREFPGCRINVPFERFITKSKISSQNARK
jgi:hypothetical protein